MIANRHILTLNTILLPLLMLIVACPLPAMAGENSAAPSDMRTLVGRLLDHDRAIRKTAVAELRNHGTSALPALEDTYRTGGVTQRRGAIVGIALTPVPALGMELLFDALGDPDTQARSLAAHTLARMGEKAAPGLVTLLGDTDIDKRNAAGYSLNLMGTAAVPSLTKGLASNDEYSVAKAAWLLGRLGEKARPAAPALIRALGKTAHFRAMTVVAEAIDLIAPEPALAVHHLVLLNHDDTAPSFRRVGGKAAPILVRLLARPGTPLAASAFKSLLVIGPPALAALREGLHKGPLARQVACALVMLKIDPDTAGELPLEVVTAIQNAQRYPIRDSARHQPSEQ